MYAFKPLEGLTVVDITEGVAGPFAAQYLADLGANVIKVERFEGDWGRTLGTLKYGLSTQYMALNRNKKNVSIDFKSEQGNKIVKELLYKADFVITSFRPGVTEKYGLGYEQVREVNPNVIYGRVSGYGYSGPLSKKTGVDTVIQANSGVMNYVGPEDGDPYRIGFAVIDQVAARDLVSGMLSSYIEFLKTGRVLGPVDASLFATAAVLQSQQWQDYLETGNVPMRVGNRNPVIVPSAVYKTKDEKYISVAAVRNEQFHRLCHVIDAAYLIEDERFKDNITRMKNRDRLEEILVPAMRRRTQKEWVTVLEEHDILVAPVNTLEDIYEDPNLFESIPQTEYKFPDEKKIIKAIGLPFTINHKSNNVTYIPPAKQGEHTIDVLQTLGYTVAEIQELQALAVVR